MINIRRHLITHTRTRPALRMDPKDNFRIIQLKKIVVHWTANRDPGSDAARHREYFQNGAPIGNGKFRSASAHYFVDNSEIVQIIPQTEVAFHCGDLSNNGGRTKLGTNSSPIVAKPPNYYTIGIELCANIDGDWVTTMQKGAELCAMLVHSYGLGIEDVVRHYDVTGKNCPAPLIDPIRWQGFKDLVSQALSKILLLEAFMVVTPHLNVRSGKSTQSPILYQMSRGERGLIHTIGKDWVQIAPGQWINKEVVKIVA